MDVAVANVSVGARVPRSGRAAARRTRHPDLRKGLADFGRYPDRQCRLRRSLLGTFFRTSASRPVHRGALPDGAGACARLERSGYGSSTRLQAGSERRPRGACIANKGGMSCFARALAAILRRAGPRRARFLRAWFRPSARSGSNRAFKRASILLFSMQAAGAAAGRSGEDNYVRGMSDAAAGARDPAVARPRPQSSGNAATCSGSASLAASWSTSGRVSGVISS